MRWMPRGRPIYPCRACPTAIRPMQVLSPFVKFVEMAPSCLIFPLHKNHKIHVLYALFEAIYCFIIWFAGDLMMLTKLVV